MDKDQEPDISFPKASEDMEQLEWVIISKSIDLEIMLTSLLTDPSTRVCLIIFIMVELEKYSMLTQDQ